MTRVNHWSTGLDEVQLRDYVLHFVVSNYSLGAASLIAL